MSGVQRGREEREERGRERQRGKIVSGVQRGREERGKEGEREKEGKIKTGNQVREPCNIERWRDGETAREDRNR